MHCSATQLPPKQQNSRGSLVNRRPALLPATRTLRWSTPGGGSALWRLLLLDPRGERCLVEGGVRLRRRSAAAAAHLAAACEEEGCQLLLRGGRDCHGVGVGG